VIGDDPQPLIRENQKTSMTQPTNLQDTPPLLS
jgi:hypothetical protein